MHGQWVTLHQKMPEPSAANRAPGQCKRPLQKNAGKRMEKSEALGRRKEHAGYDPEGQRIALRFFIRICRKRVCDRQRGIYQQHDMQKIQMALMLAAQQLQQNRAQRFRSELFMQKAWNQLVNSRPDKQRKQDMRNVPFPDAPDGQAAASIQKQNAAAHQKQRNRASCKAAPEQAFQPCSAPDLPAEQDLAGYMDHHHADDRKRFRVINGGDPAAGHRLRRFLKEPHTILPSTGSGR